MKYVAAVEYFPNCRRCDSGFHSDLKFFNSVKEILTFALKNKDSYELKYVYSTKKGRELFDVDYHLGKHSCTGVSFKYKGLHIRTQDDGHGNLIWVKV